MPNQSHPIYIIGAGGIVTDAHLPAYKLAGFQVLGLFDINKGKALSVAAMFGIPQVFSNLEEMIQNAPENIVYDIAVPGSEVITILKQLPDDVAVLIQKPMGDTLAEAKTILQITRNKKLIAGVNFQLRYAPYITEARRMLADGIIGDICGIDIFVNVFTPWHLWKFLYRLPRVEILYHSIHYIDLIRSVLGNPEGILAKTTKHPDMKELASVKTNIIMDYGDYVSANINTNHCHNFGKNHQNAYIKIEGIKGAIKMTMGSLMDYPAGSTDSFEYTIIENSMPEKWIIKEIKGSWFPHAFIGSMAEVMLAVEGSKPLADNSVEDCIYTMACVEAAYESNRVGGISIGDYI